MQFSSTEAVGQISCSRDDKTSSTSLAFPPRFPETASKGWYWNIPDMIIEKCLWKCLSASDWFVLQILLQRLCFQSFSSYNYRSVFSKSVFPHSLQLFWKLSTTNNLCNFWHSKFQQINTHPFCCWDDIFTQNWSCSSPNNFCNCTESPPMLSTNTSIEWKLHLSWSNHHITSFSLEMIVGGISEHQYKTIDTERYDGCFFTARVSEVNMNKMKKSFEQWSELQVVKCLINHVLFSSYNVSNLELWNEKKTTQQQTLRVASDFVLNQVRIYHERVCADKVVSKFWFLRSFSS